MDTATQLDLSDALTQYQTTFMASRNLADATRRHYLIDLADVLRFLKELGITTAQQVHRRHLEAYLAELDRRGFKGSTRRRKIAAIRSLFSFLEDQGHLTVSPAAKLIPPEQERPQPRVLSKAEYERLRDQVKTYGNNRDEAIIEVLLQTGMRLSELTRLSVQDLELPAKISRDQAHVGTVTILGKGRKTRTLTLNYKAVSALKRWLTVRGDSTNPPHLFLSNFKNGMTPRAIEHAVEKYLKLAGIQHASVHTLRHTFATHHVKNKTSLRSVQQMLGHASLKTTEIYVHLARDQMDKEMQDNAL